MKKYWLLCLTFGMLILCLFIAYEANSFSIEKNNSTEVKDEKSKMYSSSISMMLETSVESGEYKEATNTTWAEAIEKGYTFNETRSTCENGSTLSWNEANKTVTFSGNISDKCYVYFDKNSIGKACKGQDIGSCIATNYKLDSSIIYHDGQGTYGEYEAGDNSYRYTGANPNNYVCFGNDCTNSDSLYRIIGVFNNQVKLIKNTSIGQYVWTGSESNSSNIWSSSALNIETLNGTYLNGLGDWSNKIVNATWQVGGNTTKNILEETNAKINYQNELTNPAESTIYDAKIGLMYVNDYRYAVDSTKANAWSTLTLNYNSADPSKDYRVVVANNWMYSGVIEWTISRNTDRSDIAVLVNSDGCMFSSYVVKYCEVRPVFYLDSSVKLMGGFGTIDRPFMIN